MRGMLISRERDNDRLKKISPSYSSGSINEWQSREECLFSRRSQSLSLWLQRLQVVTLSGLEAGIQCTKLRLIGALEVRLPFPRYCASRNFVPVRGNSEKCQSRNSVASARVGQVFARAKTVPSPTFLARKPVRLSRKGGKVSLAHNTVNRAN